ncbi:MAG TPA: MFS transporter, partial [Frankiaceae bacterium]|nr:MFS transporter [Frankiaceae bacterium]
MPSVQPAPRTAVGPDARTTGFRRTVGAVFFVHGLLFASWAAHIPHVKARVGLSDGGLGLVLLATPVGSIAAMAIGAWLLPRVGSRRMVTCCLVGYCASGPFVGLATSAPALFAALLCWGAFQGTLDVSMNTQAIACQRAAGRPIMSGMHGRWSLGALAGAGVGALGVGIGLSLALQLLILGVAALPLVRWSWRLPDDHAEPESADSGPRAARLPVRRWPRTVVLLAAIAFASMLCEGAAADWSAVYLRNSLGAAAVIASLGYAFFAAAMVLVRLGGDAVIARRGTSRVVSALCAAATVGFAAGLISGNTVVALIGLAMLGGGVATVVPTIFSAAGDLPGIPTSSGIAAVSACGWAGFVCGPPLIGQLASATSLPVALSVVPVLTAFIAIAMTARFSPRGPAPR